MSDVPSGRRNDRQGGRGALGRDPDFVRSQLPFGRLLTSYFSPEVRGIENVPVDGPVLIVGNHSGMFYMPDAWITGLAVTQRRGVEAATFSLAYDLLFLLPPLGRYLRRVGLVPATPDNALQALARGAAVIVYPGGDYEACRPWSEAGRVDMAGRTGFVRIALRTGVPVVPVVAHGGHNSLVVLWRGQSIASALHLDRLRIKVFPIVLGPLGLPSPIIPAPPLPAAVVVEFLPALHWGLDPEGAEDGAVLEARYKEIAEVMQTALDRLGSERPHPLTTGVGLTLRRMGRIGEQARP